MSLGPGFKPTETTRRRLLSMLASMGAGSLLAGCKDVSRAFTPEASAQQAAPTDPRVPYQGERTAHVTPLGATVWLPTSWAGWTQAHTDEVLAEVDATPCEDVTDPSIRGQEGPTGETVGEFCARSGYQVWAGQPSAIELPHAGLTVLVAGVQPDPSADGVTWLVSAWTLTRDLPTTGRHAGLRLAALGHEARHARRRYQGLPVVWPGHPTSTPRRERIACLTCIQGGGADVRSTALGMPTHP